MVTFVLRYIEPTWDIFFSFLSFDFAKVFRTIVQKQLPGGLEVF